ncbi:MAG: shikimate dehydrogenase, partial [Solirubrobacteraceae bacterium]
GAIPATRAEPADVLVNCTSVGLDGADPFDRLPLAAHDLGNYGCVVDLVYPPTGSILIAAARERGVPTVDGLELLVGQGALSFERFTGRAASRDAMWAAVGAS